MAPGSAERIIARPFQDDEDFWRVRNLLIETYPITPVDFNWEIRRWDGQRYHLEDSTLGLGGRWEQTVCLWETEDGRLVGAVHPEGEDDAWLELHPDYRHLEEEMIAWAEEHLATPIDDGQRR